MEDRCIVEEQAMDRMLMRLSHEIIEGNGTLDSVYLVGIKRRGVPLAKRIKANIERFSDLTVGIGELDITLYRDDLKELFPSPIVHGSDIPFDVNGKAIVLIDDVLYTGRTARAAMDALIERGRPASIRLCVAVDRGHRELPLRPDYVGKNIPTSHSEMVSVMVDEYDGKTGVALYQL